MGQSESKPEHREVPIEQLSHELALRFASKCFSHLEITHYKDNFKSLADHQDDVEYWKEETLCQFLCLPASIHAGSVLYAMVTYLGAFPFPSLAPCIVTREAMLKVVTILTGRYKKVLKRGDADKNKLLFRSLAVFDRRTSTVMSPTSERKFEDLMKDVTLESDAHSSSRGFAVDEPIDNNEEDEDDDDLALAALDSLDAIEVFKEDEKKDRKIHHAHIPARNLERLLMLLLLFSPLTALDNPSLFMTDITDEAVSSLQQSAKALVAAFNPDPDRHFITYSNFMRTMTMVTKSLFRPLNPIFEHFLFSRHLDLSKHKSNPTTTNITNTLTPHLSPIQKQDTPTILTDTLLAQLDTSIRFITPSQPLPSNSSIFHTSALLTPLYSISTQGTSLSSLSRQLTSWESATLLILTGTHNDTSTSTPYTFGAYLPTRWRESSPTSFTTPHTPTSAETEANKSAVLFELSPRHAIFTANPYNTSPNMPPQYFSSRTGLALGCIIPPSSRLSTAQPALGPVSLLISNDFSTATFQHDPAAGTGAFLTDPRLEEVQTQSETMNRVQGKKIEIEVDGLEIWGVSFGGDDEVERQRKRLEWEEGEAARRRGVNFGGDEQGARQLLEMAGIIGDGGRSGGSV